MAPVTPSPATEPRRSARLRANAADADADPDPDAEVVERGDSRGKRQRRSAGKPGARGSAAKDRPKEAEHPAAAAAGAPGMMAVDDAGSGINDDICAEEPDTEEMEMGEEDDEASAADADAAGGEGSAETTLGAGKKRVARPSAKKRRAGASEDRFVGDPVPDDEARQRWPQRYTAKVIRTRRPSPSHPLRSSTDRAHALSCFDRNYD
jgi:hypothetical protein